MRDEYDFSSARKNPYADRLKAQVTIEMDTQTANYFQTLAEQTGIPYQTLIKLYLKDCADNHRAPNVSWG